MMEKVTIRTVGSPKFPSYPVEGFPFSVAVGETTLNLIAEVNDSGVRAWHRESGFRVSDCDHFYSVDVDQIRAAAQKAMDKLIKTNGLEKTVSRITEVAWINPGPMSAADADALADVEL